MRCLLDLGDGVIVECRDAYHAQSLGSLFAAMVGLHPAQRGRTIDTVPIDEARERIRRLVRADVASRSNAGDEGV